MIQQKFPEQKNCLLTGDCISQIFFGSKANDYTKRTADDLTSRVKRKQQMVCSIVINV